ncbi:trypsin-like serine peptidase [Marimonas lutisalis]|uniref:trypsin-like serine peptidase n=1 Tax=Marimonas lutisalis TaxID=2545756 RepID=UPI0010F6521C|nr:trypsin-like peptidase domain-containing protein [Marimonas lutisalis]
MTSFALLIAALPVRSEQASALIPLDNRSDLLGWEAVGRLEIAGTGYCTGVLIATDIVLTAAHCIFDRRTGEAVPTDRMSFRAGYSKGTSIAARGVSAAVASPEYFPTAPMTLENIRADVALLKLDQGIPAATAAPFALLGAAESGTRVSVVSYGQGRSTTLSWQRECGLLWRQSGMMAFDCDVTFGSSGAPVFVRHGQRARILSLVSSGGARNGKPISFGTELPRAVDQLKRKLRALPVKPETATAGERHIRVGEKKGASGAKFVKVPGS